MIRKYLLLLLMLTALKTQAQKIATFEVEPTKVPSDTDVPINMSLDGVTFLSDTALSLVEIQGNSRIAIPFQITPGSPRTISWIVKGNSGQKKKIYELTKSAPSKQNNIVAKVESKYLTVQSGDKNLLRYYYATIYPPAGVDTAYRKSGFIHPLWSPHGQELTRIQPKDHYHHYGLWNPWTHVLYKGDTVDFWNIGDRKGTVRFSKFVSTTSGPVFSEFQVVHEHVVTKKGAPEEVAINELQTIRVYRPEANQDYYIVDFTSQLNCATENPVTLLEYRYGGFGWRTTEEWNNTNSEVITSEGKNRKQADGSTARWCIVQGAVSNDYAGAVMMSYPTNYNHPEPLRIWPENQYNRGDMFANFSPTKNKDWDLVPGQKYTLKYRLIVFNGKFTKEKAEGAWNNYTTLPKVIVK